jgi:hypothetical protein
MLEITYTANSWKVHGRSSQGVSFGLRKCSIVCHFLYVYINAINPPAERDTVGFMIITIPINICQTLLLRTFGVRNITVHVNIEDKKST